MKTYRKEKLYRAGNTKKAEGRKETQKSQKDTDSEKKKRERGKYTKN